MSMNRLFNGRFMAWHDHAVLTRRHRRSGLRCPAHEKAAQFEVGPFLCEFNGFINVRRRDRHVLLLIDVFLLKNSGFGGNGCLKRRHSAGKKGPQSCGPGTYETTRYYNEQTGGHFNRT